MTEQTKNYNLTESESKNLDDIQQSGKKLDQLEGMLYEHISDTQNPHKVTKSQVGLGNVPDVSTNNQTPAYKKGLEWYVKKASGYTDRR